VNNNNSKIIYHYLFMSARTENLIVGFLDRGMKQETNGHTESVKITQKQYSFVKRTGKDLTNGEH
jgi:predicted transcriptional regulator